MTLSSAFSPIKYHPVQQFFCHLRQHFSQCWYKVVKFNKMWMLKLLAFSFVIVVFAGITESGRRQYWPCSRRSCQVSPWSHWGQCSHQCGTSGTQTRKRKKTIAESCGGSCLFTLSETRPCNTDNCQNSGTSTSQGCSCKPGYRGTCCEKGKLKLYRL